MLWVDELGPELLEEFVCNVVSTPVTVIGSSDSSEVGDSLSDLFLGVSGLPVGARHVELTRPN